MNQTRLLTWAVAGLLLLNLGTLGYLALRPRGLHPPRPGTPGGPPPDGPATLIIDRLQFDEGQQARYRTLVRQHQQASARLAEASTNLYQRYYKLLSQAQPDTAAAQALSSQIAANQRAVAELNFAHFAQIRALCRPDQLPAFVRLLDDLTHLFRNPPGRGRVGRREGPRRCRDVAKKQRKKGQGRRNAVGLSSKAVRSKQASR
ncbi:periplasmic heavy metal sensor [Fibrella aestuarina]|nr:periplasmic heavy metal sensor [Fibrella aestuarina]